MAEQRNRTTFDRCDPVQLDQARRIGLAWVELRRGAASVKLRDHVFGHDSSLDQGQMDALDLLVRRERTMKQLAARLHIDPSAATRAVQRLVRDGLVERAASPDDGRVVIIRATEEGLRRHAEVAERRVEALQRIIEEFSSDEHTLLADLLDRFTDALDHVIDDMTDDMTDEVPDVVQ